MFPRIDLEKELKELENLKGKQEEKKAKKVDKGKENAGDGDALEKKDEFITIDDFAKVDLRVAKVLEAEKVEGTDKLLKLRLQVGDEIRQVVSGIAKYYNPEELTGKYVILVANLKPVKLRGIESQGMILAASNSKDLSLITVDRNIDTGSKIT